MKSMLALCVCLAALGCEISPVVSAPAEPGSRYSDCDGAAKDYCEDFVRASEEEMDACVAEYRFKCVSSGASLPPPRRL